MDESALKQLQEDTSAELQKVSARRQELKALSRDIQGIMITGREQVTPAVPATFDNADPPVELTPEIPETTETVMDVKPVDSGLNAPMNDTRRDNIFDAAVAEKTRLSF